MVYFNFCEATFVNTKEDLDDICTIVAARIQTTVTIGMAIFAMMIIAVAILSYCFMKSWNGSKPLLL